MAKFVIFSKGVVHGFGKKIEVFFILCFSDQAGAKKSFMTF